MSSCNSDEANKVKDDVLVYCSEGSPETFNPQLSTSGTTFDASSRPLYNRLVEFEPGSTFIKPALATQWKVSRSGTEYTFYLRQDVPFHYNNNYKPTRNFNADDVLFSFNRQRFNQHPFHSVTPLSYGYFVSMGLGELIKDIQKIDDYKIKFILNEPNSTFLATLAMDFASILSKEYADHLLKQNQPANIDIQPIGTGPFQLTRYQPDAYIRYKAHENFWGGQPRLKNLVFAITPDPSLRFARTFAKECDIMANPLPVHIEVAGKQTDLEILNEAGLNIAFLSLNTAKTPFNNQTVRIALNHAINKQAIIKKVYQDTASVAKNPIPPSMWSYDNDVADYDFDPERARKLLASAGYEDGFEMTISTMSAQRSYNPNAKKMAQLIQQDLKDVGIKVTIDTYEFGTFLSRTRAGEHHSALMGWISDNGDPDNFFTPLLSCAAANMGTNSSFWCDQKFSNLLRNARIKNDLRSRQSLYKQAQRQFKIASPWVPIAHATQHMIVNPRVQNFKIYPSGGVYFKDVFLSEKLARVKAND
ncbi:ABC transporter substrate-binding protein [Aliikangiella marina]|uniref:ABC transporter substrate-binding protein n=1 Tax=Aliikangiella marina TaxID=1712262 RepID=A0A545TEP7_9GAMM|nr:ABC transporter substrate-binding protein [Aliikangiella marina]